MKAFATVIFVLCLGIDAYAQQDRPEDRIQVRGIAGWAGFGDTLINHSVLGAAVDARLVAGLLLGPEVLYNIGPGKDRDLTLMPVLTYDFRRLKRVTPFVSVGAGVNRDTGGTRWSNSVTFGASAGVKFAISKHLFVAPEVRGGWEPAARATVSLGYRF